METATEPRVGAYEIVRKTKAFPESFWAVYEDLTPNKERVLIEIAGDGTLWVPAWELDQALVKGDVVKVE